MPLCAKLLSGTGEARRSNGGGIEAGASQSLGCGSGAGVCHGRRYGAGRIPGARPEQAFPVGYAGADALAPRDSSASGGRPQKAIAGLEYLQAPLPSNLGKFLLTNVSCLYPTYVRGEAYLAAGQGKPAAEEFQKILDHDGLVWNCWTGSLAHLGVARGNALQAKTSQGADADAARTRALAAYKDFLVLWKDADPEIPIFQQAKAEYAKLQ